jgi:PAS domain S-box-containing protein
MNPKPQELKRLYHLSSFRDCFAAGAASIVSLALITVLFIMPSSLPEAYGMEPSKPPDLRAVTAKPLKTVIVADYFPYTFVNEKGIPDGFAVDIAKAVTHVMGLKVEISVGTWEYAQKTLKNGTIDFLPMMADTPERRPSFDFSVPHTIGYDAIFVRKGTPSPSSIEDLAGKAVIVMNKDAAHEYLLSSGVSDKIKLQLVDSLPDGLRLLASGKGNALLMPKLVGLILMKQLNITNVEEYPLIIDAYRRPFSFAVKEGNNALLERLSQGLSIIKNTGEYEDIYGKWFGALEPRGLPWTTVLKYLFGIALVFLLIGMTLLLWSISLRRQVALRTRSLEAEIKRREKTENDLRESEERYRVVFDNAAIGIDTLDRYGRITKVNQALCNMLGYTENELKELTFEEITHPDDRRISKQELESHIGGENPSYRLEKRYLRKNGEVCWCDLSTSSIKDGNGYQTGTVGVIADITKRKKAEQELLAYSNEIKDLYDNAPCGYHSIDEHGTFVRMNATLLSWLGYSREEILGKKKLPEILSAESREVFKKTFPLLKKNGEIREIEVNLVRKDGSILPALMNTSSVKGPAGEFVMSRSTIFDITEIKKARKALLAEQEFTERIFNSSDTHLAVVDPSGRIVRVNTAWISFALSNGALDETTWGVGANYFRQLSEEPSSALGEEAFDGIREVQSGKLSRFEIEYPCHSTSEQRWFVMQVTPLPGMLGTVLVSHTNVTRLELAEEALRVSEHKYRLLAENTQDVIWQTDPDLRFTYVNPAIERMTGYTPYEWIGSGLAEHCDEENFMKIAQAASVAISKEGNSSEIFFESVMLKKNKEPLSIEVFGKVMYDENRFPIGLQGVTRDITDRKRTERYLKETTSFLNTLVNAIPVPIFYKDTEGRYIGFNKSYEEFYGKTQQELVGKSVFDIAPRDLAEMYHAKDNELFHNPGIQVYDSQVKDVRDAIHDVVFHKSTFSDFQGHIIGLIGVILDITERKRLEDEKGKLIIDLQNALSEVKKLSGFLPICSTCKKIRDDKGYWNEVERYIGQHSEAEFSHSICPDCMRKLYPEYADAVLGSLEKDGKQ